MQKYGLLLLLLWPHNNFLRFQSSFEITSLSLSMSTLLVRSRLLPQPAPSLTPSFPLPPVSRHSHFLRTAKAELKVNWAWWVPRWASSREPASGPWPAAISSAAAFSTSHPPSCWWDSMWELSRGYRAEEMQPTKRPASRSNESSSVSQEEAVSWRKKRQ